ncbi:MAG: hypothetical protein U0527_02175 [Candidatus Eisenbacteria bacterium]
MTTNYPEVRALDLYLLTLLEHSFSRSWQAVASHQQAFAEPWGDIRRHLERIGEAWEEGVRHELTTALPAIASSGYEAVLGRRILAALFPSVQRVVKDPLVHHAGGPTEGHALAQRMACHPSILARYFCAVHPNESVSHTFMLDVASRMRANPKDAGKSFAADLSTRPDEGARIDMLRRVRDLVRGPWKDLTDAVLDGLALTWFPDTANGGMVPGSARFELADLALQLMPTLPSDRGETFLASVTDLGVLANLVHASRREAKTQADRAPLAQTIRIGAARRFRTSLESPAESVFRRYSREDALEVLAAWRSAELALPPGESEIGRIHEYTTRLLEAKDGPTLSAARAWLRMGRPRRADFPVFAPRAVCAALRSRARAASVPEEAPARQSSVDGPR